jgi:hypothetical protein
VVFENGSILEIDLLEKLQTVKGVRVMTDKALQETLAALKKVRDEIGDSPEKARAFLVRAGFIYPDGKLTEPYRQDA